MLQCWLQEHRPSPQGRQELGSQGRFPSMPKCFDLPHRWRQKAKFTYRNSAPLITQLVWLFSRNQHHRLSLQKRTSAHAVPHGLHHPGATHSSSPCRRQATAAGHAASKHPPFPSSPKPPEGLPRGEYKV